MQSRFELMRRRGERRNRSGGMGFGGSEIVRWRGEEGFVLVLESATSLFFFFFQIFFPFLRLKIMMELVSPP